MRFVASTAGDPERLIAEAAPWLGRAESSLSRSPTARRSIAIHRTRRGIG
jgi:hypothetical protein